MRMLALLRSLRREWQCQRRDHPRQLNTALLLWAVLSAALAGVLVQQRWQVLQQRQSRQGQTDQGLLELRVNSHKITALDWGHWDPLYAYAAGDDPGFPARELDNSSIIQDGQGLMVVDDQQRVLLARGSAVGAGLSPELSRCLKGHLQQLALRSQESRAIGPTACIAKPPSNRCLARAPRFGAAAAPAQNGAGSCTSAASRGPATTPQ